MKNNSPVILFYPVPCLSLNQALSFYSLKPISEAPLVLSGSRGEEHTFLLCLERRNFPGTKVFLLRRLFPYVSNLLKDTALFHSLKNRHEIIFILNESAGCNLLIKWSLDSSGANENLQYSIPFYQILILHIGVEKWGSWGRLITEILPRLNRNDKGPMGLFRSCQEDVRPSCLLTEKGDFQSC